MTALTKLPLVGDDQTQRLIYLIERALNTLEASPLAGAVILVNQAIGTTDTRVFHGLKQRPTGYFLVGAPSDTRLFAGLVAEVTDPANFITLRLSTAALVTVAVF